MNSDPYLRFRVDLPLLRDGLLALLGLLQSSSGDRALPTPRWQCRSVSDAAERSQNQQPLLDVGTLRLPAQDLREAFLLHGQSEVHRTDGTLPSSEFVG